MALIECPESKHRISDRAVACPSCGFPITPSVSPGVQPHTTSNGKPAVAEPPLKSQISATSPPSATSASFDGFKNPRSLANSLTVLLILMALFYGIAIWGGVLKLDLLSRAMSSGEFSTAWAKTVVYSSSPIADLLFIPTAILFLRWVYVAAKNARILGTRNLRLFEHSFELAFTPGWSVGWYFVPLFNLWKPYQAVKWIWKASRNPADAGDKKSKILPLWWTFWLLSNLLSLVAFKSGQTAQSPSDYSTAVAEYMFSDAADILCCVFALLLVRSVSRRQLRTAGSIVS
jgi:Domain of unknown function (DUF4328)